MTNPEPSTTPPVRPMSGEPADPVEAAVPPLDVEATIRQARARVEFLEREVQADRDREALATKDRRKHEEELKEAKRIVSALAGSPLKGRKKTAATK